LKSKTNLNSNLLLAKLKLSNTSLFNLGNVQLSEAESIVLGLGLKFLPKTQCRADSIIQSLHHSVDNFTKRIQKAIFYKNTKYLGNDIPRLISPKVPDLVTSVDNLLAIYKSDVCKKISDYKWTNHLTQLDYLVRNNLIALANNKSIVIKPADKNLGTCVMTLAIYIAMCHDILHDVKTYKKLDEFDVSCTNSYIVLERILTHFNKHSFIKRDFNGNYVAHETPLFKSLMQLKGSTDLKISSFYALPKMHKVTVDKPLPAGRPIVSSINSCTYFTSKYLHTYLKRLTSKFKTIVRSSLEVLFVTSKLEVPKDSVILCADVRSLYPSIPIEFGLKAVKYLLTSYNMPDIEFIIALLTWVLTNNYFSFDNEYYIQIEGTAMGTPVAVEYANTVMYYIEHTIIDQYKPTLYMRFIDDIYAILPNENISKELITSINNKCVNIQLESVTIGKSGIFLDLAFEIVDKILISKVYQKPSNKYLYLPPTSNHQHNIMVNVIKQELKRYCLYCSRREDEISFKIKFYDRLLQRGYSKTYLDPLFSPTIDRNSLFTQMENTVKGKKGKLNDKKLYIVVLLPKLDLPLNLRDFLSLPIELKTNDDFKEVYGDTSIVVGRRTFKNIGRQLAYRPIDTSKSTDSLTRASGYP
jgi:hypothetical protein